MNSHSFNRRMVSSLRNAVLTLPEAVIGTLSFALMVLNTLFCASALFPVAALKLVSRSRSWRDGCNAVLNRLGLWWIGCNNANLDITKRIRWHVKGIEGLEPNGWYLVISNHQTWVDILVLQKVFHRKIPFLKFFLKKELIWVPVMGLAWWALEFPFMKRFSKEFLKKNPHLKGRDIEITRKACERFKRMPISVMNFVEGTRFTGEKHERQKAPFKHLLRPKAGGISFVLSAMGDQLTHILNVTIVYPEWSKTFWKFLCSKECGISVNVEVIPITPDLIGDYENDAKFKERFQAWLNNLWFEKDLLIESFFREGKRAA